MNEQDVIRIHPQGQSAQEGRSGRMPTQPDLTSFVSQLRQLKTEGEKILGALSPDSRAEFDSSAGVLESIVSKYRDQTSRAGKLRVGGAPDYGASRLIPIVEEFPVLEHWIYRRAKIKQTPQLATKAGQKGTLQKAQFVVRVHRSPYRKMSLEELVAAQIEKLGDFISLLTRSKDVSDELYNSLYNKHIEMQEDALRARERIETIREFVKKLSAANEASAALQYDPRSREGIEISTLVTYLQKYSGPITEFYDDCNSTIDWLFQAHASYRTFEEMIGAYSRMINAVRRKTSHMRSFIDDFNQISARIREGEEITKELSQSMLALTAGIYATGNELAKSVQSMLKEYGTLETLELPSYVNQILGGPAADLEQAKVMLGKSSFLSLPSAS